jgi:hypothetical protein
MLKRFTKEMTMSKKSMALGLVCLLLLVMFSSIWGGYTYRDHEIRAIAPSLASQIWSATPEIPWLTPLSPKSEQDLYVEVLIQQSILASYKEATFANDQNRPNDAIDLINKALGVQHEKKVRKPVDYELEVALLKKMAQSFDLIHDESRKEKALAKANQAEQSRQALLRQQTADQIKQSDKLLN